jgi:50S ribosomal subunit-associated GTPase HflX
VAEETFAELQVDPEKILPVYTKADRVLRRRPGFWVSALAGDGIEALVAEIERRRSPDEHEIAVRIPYSESREIARARARVKVLSEKDEGDALVLRLSGSRRHLDTLAAYEIDR